MQDNTQRALAALQHAASAVNNVATAIGRTVGVEVKPVSSFATVPEGLAVFNDQLGLFADGFEGFATAVEESSQPRPKVLPAAVVQLAGQTVPAIEEGPTGEALIEKVEQTEEAQKPKRKGSKS
jgi:hypothetical protein